VYASESLSLAVLEYLVHVDPALVPSDLVANVTQYLKSVQIGYPVFIAEGSAIGLMRALGNPNGVLPFSVMVDGSGRLRQSKVGAYSASELRSDLAALLR